MISFIIVHYQVKEEIFDSIQAIISSKPKVSYEIIVVDNDERKSLFKELHNEFPKVKYVANKNRGYGQGNNTGAKYAKGKYLFILNPDTKVYPGCIDTLHDFLEKNKNVGIVSPFLYEADGKRVELQGVKTLTPLAAI